MSKQEAGWRRSSSTEVSVALRVLPLSDVPAEVNLT